jgi:hypothetical protein
LFLRVCAGIGVHPGCAAAVPGSALADFAPAHLRPMLLGNAWNDHRGDRIVMTEGVRLDDFRPGPSDHNNGCDSCLTVRAARG